MSIRPVVLAALFAVASLSVGSPAHADWTKTESFEPSAKTSLKITEPANAKVTVTINGETKEEALPAIFSLPDVDAYVAVKVVAADGDAWTGKVEVKAHKQTVVKLGYTPKAAAKPQSSAKYIGQLQNWTHKCGLTERETLRLVVMKDGTQVYETTLRPNQAQSNVELPAGQYSVRMYKAATFLRAKELEVTKDGWVFSYGC